MTYTMQIGSGRPAFSGSFLDYAISRQPIGLPIRPLSKSEAESFVRTGALPKQERAA